MISRLFPFLCVTALLFMLTTSCAGDGSAYETPITPDLTRQIESLESGHYLWAWFDIYVDPVENVYEIMPLRQVSDHWNILKFLEQGPCTNCVSILGMVDGPDGTKMFDVRISHPFPSANLTGFDVRGIAMFAGSHNFHESGLSTPDRYAGDGALVNAQGFTTLYNGTTAGSGPDGLQGYLKGKYTPPMTPNALLNGYIRHVSPGATNTRNMFYSGSAIIETYTLDMPDTQFVFGYAVDASWTNPTTKPVTNPVNDFPAEANCPEPWKIEVTEETIGQGLTDQGGETKLYIDVYDHQGKVSYFAPVIECQELFAGTANAVWNEDGDGYTRFEVTIENEEIAPEGEYMCLISVEDTANATAPDWLDLTAYQIVNLTVAEFIPQENLPPTAIAHADPVDPQPGQTVDFFDDSTDPDGADDIIKWEWDFSFDPIDGFQVGSEEQNPSLQYPSAGTYKVQLRVTDSVFHSDMLDEPLTIEVQGAGNEPPIAGADADNTQPMVNTLVHFYDASIDPDGIMDIVFFEWDTDGDGFYDKFGKDTTKIYTTGGDYLVQHRVKDTAENEDELDEPLLIEVNGPPVADAEASSYSAVMGEMVTLTNLSFDDDGNGDIDDVYWDIDGNGDYDDPVDIQDDDVIELTFFEGGLHQIGLKIVDEWGLDDELDPMLEIYVEPFEDFCVNLIDQYNSADHLYGIRSFDYYDGHISGLSGLDYDAPKGPWDFTTVPPSAPAVCSWLLPTDPDVPNGAKSQWPDADFFFKEDAPTIGQDMYCPHLFDFADAENGDLKLQGQYMTGSIFEYNDTFEITHPICHPWFDSGSGDGTLTGVSFSISWDMQTLGTGPAIFTISGNQTVLNCILIRHHMSFVDTDFGGYMTFHILSYQWIDDEGNEVAFMQATNGMSGNNFTGNTFTGQTICRALKSIS